MKTILLVDDEPAQLKSLGIGLLRQGYRIVEALDGQAALHRLDDFRGEIEMVVTDYAMPGIDGLELLQRIRRKFLSIPVILITGHGDKSLVIKAMKNRCDSFIEKPFIMETLMLEIQRINEFRSRFDQQVSCVNSRLK